MTHPTMKPAPALRVGVVGHTSGFVTDPVRATVGVILDAIRSAAQESVSGASALYSSPTCQLSLVSCLAPGADQLVAETALIRGYSLATVIPGLRSDYRARLANKHGVEAEATFDRLLSANPSAVVEVAPARLDRHALDQESTRLVVEHSDLVIAIWQGGNARAGSCTTAGVHAAWARGLCVIHVDPRVPSQWTLRLTRDTTVVASEARGKLAGIVQGILSDPFAPSDAKSPASEAILARPRFGWPRLYDESADERRKRTRADQQRRRARFFDESLPPKKPRWFSSFWNRLFELPAKHEQKRQRGGPPPEVPPIPDGVMGRIAESFGAQLKTVDDLAVYYMHCYRSAFAGTYVLGGLAVLCAALASIRFGGAHWPMVTFAAFELFLVGAIWLIYRRARDRQWHTRAVDYRLLAEMFRHTQFLALLGVILPEAGIPRHWQGTTHRGHWVHWYYQAITRQIDFGLAPPSGQPAVPLVIDDGYLEELRAVLASNWVGDQAEYHGGSFRRYRVLEWRLHLVSSVLFGLVAVSCLVHLLLPAICAACGIGSDASGHASEAGWRTLLDGLLLCVGAAAPAFAAGLHAIGTQAEAARLAESYERMEEVLRESLKEFTKSDVPTSLSGLTRLAREVADVMLAEVEDWQTAYRFHAVTMV